MEKDELFKLVAVLTAKNTALEEEIKRLEKQTHRLWEDLKEFDYDAEVLREEIEQTNLDHSPSVESSQKINSINARLNGTNSKLKELVEKVDELDGYYKMCLKHLIDDDKQFNLE